MPPTSGATITTQPLESASPPTKSAGPKLLAGFTDVPVNEMPRICTGVNERLIVNQPLFF